MTTCFGSVLSPSRAVFTFRHPKGDMLARVSNRFGLLSEEGNCEPVAHANVVPISAVQCPTLT